MIPKEYKISKDAFISIRNNSHKIGYIKGYGGKFRIMDINHNPICNISSSDMGYLKHHGCVEVDGLVYKLIKPLP